eukprot:Gb_21893 [translate_table: standard]
MVVRPIDQWGEIVMELTRRQLVEDLGQRTKGETWCEMEDRQEFIGQRTQSWNTTGITATKKRNDGGISKGNSGWMMTVGRRCSYGEPTITIDHWEHLLPNVVLIFFSKEKEVGIMLSGN